MMKKIYNALELEWPEMLWSERIIFILVWAFSTVIGVAGVSAFMYVVSSFIDLEDLRQLEIRRCIDQAETISEIQECKGHELR